MEVNLLRTNNTIKTFRGGKFKKPGGALELLPGEEQKMYKLKTDLTDLEREERLIDTHIRWMKQVLITNQNMEFYLLRAFAMFPRIKTISSLATTHIWIWQKFFQIQRQLQSKHRPTLLLK